MVRTILAFLFLTSSTALASQMCMPTGAQPVCPGFIQGNPVISFTVGESVTNRSFPFGANLSVKPGDVVLCNPASETGLPSVACDASSNGRLIWSDVFRITCADPATNTGCTGSLFSDVSQDNPKEDTQGGDRADQVLPVVLDPNTQFFFEEGLPGGLFGLDYVVGNTTYHIVSEVPEPSSLPVVTLLLLVFGARKGLHLGEKRPQ